MRFLVETASKHQRQRDLKAGAATLERPDDNAAVVEDDDLLDERKAEPRAAALRREERLEHAIALLNWNPWAVVIDAHVEHLLRGIDLGLDHDHRGEALVHARLDCVPEQVAERLTKEHFIALDRAPGTS